MIFWLLFIRNRLVYFVFDAIIGYDFIIISCYSFFTFFLLTGIWRKYEDYNYRMW